MNISKLILVAIVIVTLILVTISGIACYYLYIKIGKTAALSVIGISVICIFIKAYRDAKRELSED